MEYRIVRMAPDTSMTLESQPDPKPRMMVADYLTDYLPYDYLYDVLQPGQFQIEQYDEARKQVGAIPFEVHEGQGARVRGLGVFGFMTLPKYS